MSYADDYFGDNAYEIEFGPRYFEILEELTDLSDQELLNKAINTGVRLDKYEHFPAYSVAVKIRQNGWTMTRKQREAMRNCLAFHLTEREM